MKDADNLDESSPASEIAGETVEQVGETTPEPARTHRTQHRYDPLSLSAREFSSAGSLD